MKKISTLLLGLAATLGASAMPVQPGTFTVTQSDGTTLTLQMMGDEYFSYYLNVETGQKMQRLANGDYALLPEAQLERMNNFAIQRAEMANTRRSARLAHRKDGLQPDGIRKVGGQYNGSLNGSKRGLVILVDFPDCTFTDANPKAAFNEFFNSDSYTEYGAIGSVSQYFKDQSYGQFDLKFDVVGPYTMPEEMATYGGDRPFDNDVYNWGTIQDRDFPRLAMHVMRCADDEVNYPDYDWDGDGEVDQVFIVYAGYGQNQRGASTDFIWPHETTLKEWSEWFQACGETDVTTLNLDGVTVNTYACSCELAKLTGTTRAGIGTACHEFAHCIGYPDFYNTKTLTGGMMAFDIMGNGGYSGANGICEQPCGFTAYERWMAGWLTPIELTDDIDIENMPALNDEPVAYIIRNQNTGTKAWPVEEYFLLENRQCREWFQYVTYITSGHGLFVTHVDYDDSKWKSNSVNADETRQRMTYVPACKTRDYTKQTSLVGAMFFPGTGRETSLTDDGYYNAGLRLYNRNTDGSYFLGAPITRIQENADGTINFRFKYGTDEGHRWTVTYDAGTGTAAYESWTQSKQNETTTLPSATIALQDWYFIGWSLSEADNADKRPADLLNAGSVYDPKADVTFYAVYGHYTGDQSVPTYKQVEDIVDGNKYLFVSATGNYALNSTAMLDKDAIQSTTSGTQVTVTDGAITKPKSGLIWAATTADGKTVQFDNAGNMLHLGATGFYVDAMDPCDLIWDKTYGLGVKDGGTIYYVQNDGKKFRLSTTPDADNRVVPFQLADAASASDTYSTRPEGGSGIIAIENASDSQVIYDLSGRRIQKLPTSGLYIQNGRVIVR